MYCKPGQIIEGKVTGIQPYGAFVSLDGHTTGLIHISEISDGFVEKISSKLKKSIYIPDEKKISCSIGIAQFMGGSKEEFETALNRADQMLYYVKRHGKSQYKLFEENEEDN